MNDNSTKEATGAAHGVLGGRSLDAGFPRPGGGEGSNDPLQAHAQAQRATGAPTSPEMSLPCLEEMGDIAPALEILLRLQAEYARREPGTSRAMRDVARKALEAEIRRYMEAR